MQPERKEKRVSLSIVPRPHQVNAHKKRKRFSVYVWHRRAGKTWFCLLETFLDASRKANGKYAYIAPLRNQAKSIAWDVIKKIVQPMLEYCTVNEGELSITLPNKSIIRLYGADNPDALRGMGFDGVVLDEVAQMKPDLWSEVVLPALTDKSGWAIFIGTPKGINTFSEIYQKALTTPGWHAELLRVSETNALKPEEIELIREELRDKPLAWAQEMECDFAAGVENALLSFDDVTVAQNRTAHESEFMYAPKILGVDVARYGDDRSSIAIRQGVMLYQPHVFSGLDLMTLAGQVARVIEEQSPDAVFVDQGGVGGGVLDRLRQLGHQVIGVDFGGKPLDLRFENRRAEMWWNMAAWVKGGGCLPPGRELATDLTAPTYTYANARGKLALESKDAMRSRGLKSPDIGDSIALTFAAPVAIRPAHERLSSRTGGESSDYDPFSEVR